MAEQIKGMIVSGEELRKTYIQRRKNFIEKIIPYTDREDLEKQGWKFIGEKRSALRMQKNKSIDELFEDEIWLVFHKMCFTYLDKDRELFIKTKADYRQIDVFAMDGPNVFIVECKANTKMGPRSLEKDIRDFIHVSEELQKSVRNFFYPDTKRVSFVFATKNIQWSQSDWDVAQSARKKRVFFWKEQDIKYFYDLANQLGSSAKYQLFSILFENTKIFELSDIEVPAIYGGEGKKKFYCFIIQPERLLKIAYIHHRRSTAKEMTETYQRMLRKNRLNSIDYFITKGGMFPNSIIVNFTRPPIFKRKDVVGDIVYGTLRFPMYYASCWIIDGQHRLYGFSDNPKKNTATVPVVAFTNLSTSEQAKLFVDINRNQKVVETNLMWDLYTDIYYDSDNDQDKILATISKAVKNLNSDDDSSLKGCIYIPSHVPSGYANLTMTTLCDALKSQKIVTKESKFFKDDFQQAGDYLAKRLKIYFRSLRELYPEDWDLKDDGFICTNISIGIFIILFRQLILYLNSRGEEHIYQKDLKKFQEITRQIFEPCITTIKEMEQSERVELRKRTSLSMRMETAKDFAHSIREKKQGFGMEILKEYIPKSKIPEDRKIEDLISSTEKGLRDFITSYLSKYHGEDWFAKGVPGDIKDYITNQIDRETEKAPYIKEELKKLSGEKKLQYGTLGHLIKIIELEANWPCFKENFGNKANAKKRLEEYKDLRDSESHLREMDDQLKKLSYASMIWVRRCIGLDK